ncbi:MAG: hypothetical protein QOE45_1698 [Frankiaceae bacterium]|jgi:hypothetical protein|nr:hypothetical protein [Frankiaceae bacterium]
MRGARIIRTTASLAGLALCVGGVAPAGATSATTGTARLERVVATFATELGTPGVDTAAIRRAGLSPTLTGAMASALESLMACARISRTAAPDAEKAAALRSCGETAVAQVDALRTAASAPAAKRSNEIDLWPVLRYEPDNNDDVYDADYVLILDAAGDDSYFNNAGGNAIDVLRGPAPAPNPGPARGCQMDGELGFECVVAAAALVDLSGNDTYQRFETPGVDSACTSDPLVRRIVLEGAGAGGVGILVDARGDDTYNGKILTIGTGHIGFGYLRDVSGNDSYTAIRTSIGASVVAGTGHLLDEAGDDSYSYYMPAGGAFDNNGVCQTTTGTIMGGSLLGGLATFRDLDGTDTYAAPSAGALGSGQLGGVGVFLDAGGDTDGYTGPAGHTNNVTLLPSAANQGLFIDS